MTSRPSTPPSSPDAAYRERLADGRLSHQRCSAEHPVFPPRIACPRCGDRDLQWHDSRGDGVVYSLTTISPRDAEPYAVVLVDLDEGFRMMSRIDGPEAQAAAIGDRVRVGVRPAADPDGEPLVRTVLEVAT